MMWSFFRFCEILVADYVIEHSRSPACTTPRAVSGLCGPYPASGEFRHAIVNPDDLLIVTPSNKCCIAGRLLPQALAEHQLLTFEC